MLPNPNDIVRLQHRVDDLEGRTRQLFEMLAAQGIAPQEQIIGVERAFEQYKPVEARGPMTIDAIAERYANVVVNTTDWTSVTKGKGMIAPAGSVGLYKAVELFTVLELFNISGSAQTIRARMRVDDQYLTIVFTDSISSGVGRIYPYRGHIYRYNILPDENWYTGALWSEELHSSEVNGTLIVLDETKDLEVDLEVKLGGGGSNFSVTHLLSRLTKVQG